MATFAGITSNAQATSDNLNPSDSVLRIIKLHQERVVNEEGPSQFDLTTIGHSWIVGSATNGLVGTNTATEDGQQQVVGGAGKVKTIVAVQNPNKTFIERFKFNNFEDTGVTDATGDYTTNNQMSFTTAQVYQTLWCYNDNTSIINARINVTSTGDLDFTLSSDNGSNFETVTDNTLHTFTNIGTALLFKATEGGSGNATLSTVKIKYNIQI